MESCRPLKRISSVKRILSANDYQPLLLGNGPPDGELRGRAATSNNVNTALRAITQLPGKRHIVVIYFSGHGRANPQNLDRDVILQLAQGDTISARTLLDSARWDSKTNRSFMGRLTVIIDACESGPAILDSRDPSKNWLLVSSSADQNSHLYTPAGDPEQSVFTYLLTNGIEHDWDTIDGNKNRIDHAGESEELRICGNPEA